MHSRLLSLALLCSLGLGGAALAQAPGKSGDKSAEKKAPAPTTPADLAYAAFNKARTEAGGKMDQARFQRVIGSGLEYLLQNPTHGRVNDAIRDLAFFAKNIDSKQPALRSSFASNLKLAISNQRYKEGQGDPAKAVLAALDAAVADYDARENLNQDTRATLREKIDTLAQTPGGARFLLERERSYSHLELNSSLARGEMHLKKLAEHPEKPVAAMAREELNIVNVRKEPAAFKFTALDGKEVDFAQLRGKVVALYFWSPSNANSTKNLDTLKQLSSNYRKRGFEVVTVSLDREEDREKLTKFVKDNKIAWPVGFDGKGAKGDLGAKLNVTSVPRLFVFDQKGILQTSIQGNQVGRLQADLPPGQLEDVTKKLLGIKS